MNHVFGIDLGTTNSLIGLEETGYLSSLVPSCVDMDTGEVGTTQYDNMKAQRSFKIDISMGKEGQISRVASSYVLKELAATAERETGIHVEDVVISVPAYFSDSQRAATKAAAEAVGLNVKGLVNEPTAAAMYIAKNMKKLYVVFDLGGGTFDCSIIDSRFGTYDVQATDGICIGGDNLDTNIMRNFIKAAKIPFHKMSPLERTTLQHFCTKQKIRMQKERKAFEVDLTQFGAGTYVFTPEAYVGIMHLTFNECITCMQKLIASWVPSTEIYDILLVGGSTHCPYLREWITEVTGKEPAELTYDPDRVVAQGAALYASIVKEGSLSKAVSDVIPGLSIRTIDGICDFIVEPNSKIPLSEEKAFPNTVTTDMLTLRLYQGNSVLPEENDFIGQINWQYDRMMEPYECNVIVKLEVDASGIIAFSAHEGLMPEKKIILNRNGGDAN